MKNPLLMTNAELAAEGINVACGPLETLEQISWAELVRAEMLARVMMHDTLGIPMRVIEHTAIAQGKAKGLPEEVDCYGNAIENNVDNDVVPQSIRNRINPSLN